MSYGETLTARPLTRYHLFSSPINVRSICRTPAGKKLSAFRLFIKLSSKLGEPILDLGPTAEDLTRDYTLLVTLHKVTCCGHHDLGAMAHQSRCVWLTATLYAEILNFLRFGCHGYMKQLFRQILTTGSNES